MASGTSQAITSEELRRRLYQTFKNRGVLDSLKSQLRNHLVHELTRPDLNGHFLSCGRRQHPSTDEPSLLILAANSIVADHLSRAGYEYSLSVFYPECGLEKEKVFTARDLLQIMKISSTSDLYKSIISNLQKDHQKGFLMEFLKELTDHHLTRDFRNAEVQTNSIPQYKESIVDKLQMIDEEYAAFQPASMREDFWETKLLKYRKQIEEQLHAELQQKLQHFKDVELAKIQIQEKELSRKIIEDQRLKLDKMYQLKVEALIAREKNAIERLQKQQEVEEKEIYMQRQSLLKDIESLRNREIELGQRFEAFEMAQNLQEHKNKSVQDNLQRRELAVKNIEDMYEQKLKNELCKYQLELQEDYRKRAEKVAVNEKRIEAEAARLHEESLIIHSSKEELQQTRAQAMKLEVELDEAKGQICLLMKQNELLNEKLKDTADYASLKTGNVQFQTEIKLLREQLDEARCENQKLCEMLNEPSAAHIALQAELKKIEYSRKLDQDEYQRQKEILEQQLQHEMERCAQVRSQLLEFEDQTRRLNVQVDDLKLQLRQTQLALENEVYRNPKPSLVDRSALDLTADRIVPPDIYLDTGLPRSRIVLEERFLYPGSSMGANYSKYFGTPSSSSDSDQDFVAGAKARIRELEKESENLEEAYRNYQSRLIQAAVQRSSEARPFSLLPVNNSSLNKISSSHPHRVTFADSFLTSEKSKPSRHPISEVSHQSTNIIEDYQTPSVGLFTSPKYSSSTPVKHKPEYGMYMKTSEGEDGSFLIRVPSVSEHQKPIATGEVQSHGSSDESNANHPSSIICGANERSENDQVDDPLSMPSTAPRFEELLDQPDKHCEIVQEGVSKLNKYWEENEDKSSVSSLHQEIISSPADACEFPSSCAEMEWIEEVEKTRGEEESKEKGNRGVEENTWHEQRQKGEENQCLESEESSEKEKEQERLEQEKGEKLMMDHDRQSPEEHIPEIVELPVSSVDPLEKYMKLIQQQKEEEQQQKEEQQEKSSKKEVEEESLSLQTLSDGKTGSPAASHEETDDTFW
ncbi:centriole and centriolar satellite protein ofd1 isoform X2 [Hypanus sabinus]|uniref:centriole and centriolar satellite protein ofd1 isoform X2 n=1 Tax=Hypanus sabinus TaxID=79690 RepID=UPI0028C43272|nr:centriole and centriolar satellite protein ofd1 isoform X2 [Hypanus sabinus]